MGPIELIDVVARGAGTVDECVSGGMQPEDRRKFIEMEAQVIKAAAAVSYRRRKSRTQVLRVWAKAATSKPSHAATRPPEANTAFSASASKSHRGKRTEQIAADKGLMEWSAQWLALKRDSGDNIAGLVHQIYDRGPSSRYTPDDGIETVIPLPPITMKVLIGRVENSVAKPASA